MISFKEYLQEAMIKKWDVQKASLEEIINLLNAHYKNGLLAIANGSVLYRGFAKDDEAKGYKIFDTSEAERTSRDSNNIYQLMMDNSSALNNYPKRKNSLICATRLKVAWAYGKPNVIIPIDGTKIAVSDKPDLFETKMRGSFYSSGDSVEDLSSNMASFFERLGIKEKIFKSTNDISGIDKALSNIDIDVLYKSLRVEGFNKSVLKLLESYPDKRMTAISSATMTPESLKLTLETFGNILPTNGRGYNGTGNEAWFSGKAVAINIKTFASIILELQKQDFPVHNFILKDLSAEISKLRLKKS